VTARRIGSALRGAGLNSHPLHETTAQTVRHPQVQVKGSAVPAAGRMGHPEKQVGDRAGGTGRWVQVTVSHIGSLLSAGVARGCYP
jgi:hypothetical protein